MARLFLAQHAADERAGAPSRAESGRGAGRDSRRATFAQGPV